jgi:hypothetical protein
VASYREEFSVDDVEFLELLAGFEASLAAAKRSLTIARALAEGYRSGVHPPEVVLDAYLATVDRDEAQLADLLERVGEFKSWLRTH